MLLQAVTCNDFYGSYHSLWTLHNIILGPLWIQGNSQWMETFQVWGIWEACERFSKISSIMPIRINSSSLSFHQTRVSSTHALDWPQSMLEHTTCRCICYFPEYESQFDKMNVMDDFCDSWNEWQWYALENWQRAIDLHLHWPEPSGHCPG